MIGWGSDGGWPMVRGEYRSSSETWKTLWFRIVFGKSNLQAYLLMVLLTVYGYACLQSSFFEGLVVRKCLVQRETLSTTLKVISFPPAYFVCFSWDSSKLSRRTRWGSSSPSSKTSASISDFRLLACGVLNCISGCRWYTAQNWVILVEACTELLYANSAKGKSSTQLSCS